MTSRTLTHRGLLGAWLKDSATGRTLLEYSRTTVYAIVSYARNLVHDSWIPVMARHTTHTTTTTMTTTIHTKYPTVLVDYFVVLPFILLYNGTCHYTVKALTSQVQCQRRSRQTRPLYIDVIDMDNSPPPSHAACFHRHRITLSQKTIA